MTTKTVREISLETGISRFTINSAASKGPLKAAASQSGSTWLIDVDHEAYKEWLRKHDEQPRVKGSTKRQ